MQIVVWGNKTACGLTQALWKIINSKYVKTLRSVDLTLDNSLSDFEKALKSNKCIKIIDADVKLNPKVYITVRSKYNLSASPYPYIVVVDDSGNVLGKFVARSQYIKPFDARTILNKILSYCSDCSDNSNITPEPLPPVDNKKKCPNCGFILE